MIITMETNWPLHIIGVKYRQSCVLSYRFKLKKKKNVTMSIMETPYFFKFKRKKYILPIVRRPTSDPVPHHRKNSPLSF
jgi:hypothetical protein